MRYNIKCEPFPIVVCNLSDGEEIITEIGAMLWMSPNMEMQTQAGGIGGFFSKTLSGEHGFTNTYVSHGKGLITLGSHFAGQIVDIDITPEKDFILQKGAFLGMESGVNMSIFFRPNLVTGSFGGEGFIMHKLSGNGKVFAEVDGSLVKYQLEPGQQMIVSTGHVIGMDSTVIMDIKTVAGLKNKLFGGYGFFNTVLTGPGVIYLQTMPISKLARSIIPYLPRDDSKY